jgi:glucose-1-phosphate thymidylyltransferase
LIESPPKNTAWGEPELSMFEFPHDVVKHNMKSLHENLQRRIASGRYSQREDGVFLGRNVTLAPQVVFDSSSGPVIVDDHATLGPFSLLRGPVYLGLNARLSEYAAIKDHVCIGRFSKIGGEVEASVIEPYTNKQHHGFLGHSYVGSWVNLGAGTCNSDLKNTYGTVNVDYGDRKVSTQMQFFGCVIGDYAKTAINTSIFTGKIIGTASMVYGFATTNVPSFVNYARTFNGMGILPAEVIVSTQARMFARRNVQQRPCDIQLIHDMYRVTAHERPDGLSDTPLSL